MFLSELKHIKQALANNNFRNYISEKKNYSYKQIHDTSNNNTAQENIRIFYCNQMHYNYKQNKFAMWRISNRHIPDVILEKQNKQTCKTFNILQKMENGKHCQY